MDAIQEGNTGGYISFGIPDKDTAHLTSDSTLNIQQQKWVIWQELAGHISVSQTIVTELFDKIETDANIHAYLAKTNLYKRKRWQGLPRAPKEESKMYEPMIKILADIINHFKAADGDTITVPWLRARMKLDHYEDKPSKQTSSPDFCLLGFGP
ncbi:hypothetical protein FA15DRAFT_705345 [Coprinopsis marcescibilis]|uniref:Fungal-type protein kinase domain-containing protein n=1 Tax=Coprinopsis marcescibilis TaxID=230819 RepID=A0A5C3KSK6_COPMA|nr:hypothetical protein FA15DRAFT_705345 [Coprinopsis marcescibilis]